MFITRTRHEREKQELLSACNRISDAILRNTDQGLFFLDARNRVLPQLSQSLARLFRREDFAHLTFEKLLAPVVTAKTLSLARSHIAQLLGTAAPREDGTATESSAAPAAHANPLSNVEVRLPNADGSFDSAQYAFEFTPVEIVKEQRAWLVRVTDVTQQVQTQRELDELRVQVQTQGEILRSVLQVGGARFAALLHRADASMKTINTVLKKPAREQDAFRNKLEETLEEVDRVRREAATFQLSALEASARQFEDALHELRSRPSLSGSDFLPLAVKLDDLYGQFALLKTLSSGAGTPRRTETAPPGGGVTANGTQVIESPKFMSDAARAVPGAQLSAPAGSLENTLRALTDHVAQEHDKTVTLQAVGLTLVPSPYQSAIKNIAIQLIRNAVMHGIEPPAARVIAGKAPDGTMRLEFKNVANGNFELLFEDDGCGLDPEHVRSTAIARGILTGENAARLRDRELIKLIFKSGYSTLENTPGEPTHGTGLALVRRYVHEAGGKVALASLLGHETRFKVTLPPLAAAAPALELVG